MMQLRTELTKQLKILHPRVYFMEAPSSAQYPYIIFDLPNSFSNEDQDIFVFDVDIWDKTDDTTDLETLADKVWENLNNTKIFNDYMQVSIYKDKRLTIRDDDPQIKRRKLIFELRYFKR